MFPSEAEKFLKPCFGRDEVPTILESREQTIERKYMGESGEGRRPLFS